jgi:hypothetical protein
MLHRLAISLVLACAASEALACRGTFSESTIVFDEAPTSMDVPVIAEVTITDMSETIESSTGLPIAVMNARIERVIRGLIDNKDLKIVTHLSDCSRIGIGRGIVAGSLRSDPQYGVELVAVQETNAERAIRKARERSK